MADRYIVRRQIFDSGPNGGGDHYIAVTKPNPGETVYHGQFTSKTIESGQFDAESTTVYYPAGELTSSVYTASGVEVFSPTNNEGHYIVRRSIADGGPMGDTYGYLKVTKPSSGETIYSGTFRSRKVDCGQFDADSMTVYDSVGKTTEQRFGVETF